MLTYDVQRVIQEFTVQQRSLSDLLSETPTTYMPTPVTEESDTPLVNPDSRMARRNAQIIMWNPYFKQYAREARQVLGLPEEGLESGDVTDFMASVGLGINMNNQLIPYIWAIWWFVIHVAKASLSPPASILRLPSFLPQWLQRYGEGDSMVAVPEPSWPQWTHRAVRYPSLTKPESEGVPLNKIAGLFLSAFDLPTRLYDLVRWYILTGDETFLRKGSNPLEVKIEAPLGIDGRLHVQVVVNGLDTSTVKADWVDIWDRQIAPLLDRWYVNDEIQGERLRKGQPPLTRPQLEADLRRGRRRHQAGLKAARYAPFFEFWLEQRTDDLCKAIIDYQESHPQDESMKGGDIEPRTIRANIKSLDQMMAPRR